MSDSDNSDTFSLREELDSGMVPFAEEYLPDREESSDLGKLAINADESQQSSILRHDFQYKYIEDSPLRKLPMEDVSTEHPLETIEKYERNISSKLGLEQDLDTKFILSNFKTVAEAKFASIAYNGLDTITQHCFPDENNEIPLHNDEYWGSPRCVAIYPGEFIAVGTSHAIVVLFNYTLTNLQKLGTHKEKEFGAVTCIDISFKDMALICGYETGYMVLWSIEKNTRLKKVKPPEKCPIMSIKFLKETRQKFMATTAKGSIYSYKIEQVLMKLSADKKLLYPTENRKKLINNGTTLSEGFCGIQILSKEITKNHPLGRSTIIALNSFSKVILVVLEPSFRIIHVLERPTGILNSILPCISWGRGAIPGCEDNKHPLLALSWGKKVRLFQLEALDKGLKEVGLYSSDENIFHVEWFSENNLLIYNSKNELKVLYSGNFNPNITNPNLTFNYAQAVMNSQIIDPEIRSQLYYEGRVNGQAGPTKYYNNTIRGVESARRMFVMGDKRMFVGKHYEWNEYIKDLTEKAEWLTALALCVEFYKGTIKKYAGIPNNPEERKQALQPISIQLINSYISSISKITNTRPDWVTAILTTIDFLVSIGDYKYLFVDMNKTFEQFNVKDLFLQCLEPFILKNRITYVPNDAFREIVRFYISRDKPEVIQYLIVNLPVESLDFEFAIILCMENNLLTALLYLCSHKSGVGLDGPDFLTPIAKAINTYQRNLESTDNKEYAKRFLWFLHMTINGRMFPHGVIPENIWEKQIKDIIVLLFEEQNIDLMLKAEPFVSFEILKLFFQPTIARLVESFAEGSVHIIGVPRKSVLQQDGENQQENKELKEMMDNAQRFQEVQTKFLDYMKNKKLQAQMLGLIYYCGKKTPGYENQLYYLFAELIVSMNYDLPTEIVEECICYILENDRIIPPWEVNKKLLEDIDEELERVNSNEERSVLVLEMLKKSKNKMSKLDKIALLADNSELVDVRVYLLQIAQQYKKGFELYLSQHKEIYKMKVFPWLEEIIPFLKQSNLAKFNQIKEDIIFRLSDLVAINSEKARKVVLGLDKSLEIEVIHYLKPFPYLQLNYLKRILLKRRDGFEVPDDFLILHIKLLCQLFPKQVLPEVIVHNYPLDECLKLCKENGVKDALGFFLEKTGDTMEALKVWIDFFLSSAKKKLQKIDQKKGFSVGHLSEKFNSVRGVCLRNTKLGDLESQNLWFYLLRRMLKFFDENIANRTNDPRDPRLSRHYTRFVKAFSEYVSILFDDLTKNVLVESLMTELQEYKDLKLGELKTSLLGLLQTYHYEDILLKEASTLLKGDIYDNVSYIYTTASEGFKTGTVSINEAEPKPMIMFDCGHVFPRDCVESKLCLICTDIESIKADSLLSNLKKGNVAMKTQRLSISGPPVYQEANELLLADRDRLSAAYRRRKNQQQNGETNFKHRLLTNFSKFDDTKVEKSKDWDEFIKKAI